MDTAIIYYVLNRDMLTGLEDGSTIVRVDNYAMLAYVEMYDRREILAWNKMNRFISKYILHPFTIIALCLFVRLLLLFLGWPHSNVDESTVGEMAINIAYHGDHPVFFYGQDYMGALQAYLAAGLFSLFDASLFNLRLAQLLLLAIFLGGIYILTKLLYSRGLALFTTVLLGFGNYLTIYRETQAIGGYPDTLAFGALVFLLASWLAG